MRAASWAWTNGPRGRSDELQQGLCELHGLEEVRVQRKPEKKGLFGLRHGCWS